MQAGQPELRVYEVPTGELVPYAGNAKDHPDWQVGQIVASIERFGFSDPVGVWHDPDGRPVIVEGHGRVMAAKELGMESVPCVALDHLDDEGRRAYALAHNQLTMNSGWDDLALSDELADLADMDMGDFGFDVAGDWFETRERWDRSTDGESDEYREFVEKFDNPKTTDDCYTPDNVYDAVADWVAAEYGVDRSRFVRPFRPGGDYEAESYPDGCAVVDNPPFSIIAEIIRFYCDRGVPFFLFAPSLTLLTAIECDVTYVAVGVNVTYENGADVGTSFITNMDDCRLRTAPALYEAVKAANDENLAATRKSFSKYIYPDNLLTAAIAARWCKYGIDYRLDAADCVKVPTLDAMREAGKSGIYGGGLLLSERAAAERAAAERAAAERAAAERAASERWQLSEREMAIVATLGAA